MTDILKSPVAKITLHQNNKVFTVVPM